jgi:hypothetical protein
MTEADKREQYLLQLEQKNNEHKEKCKKYYKENRERQLKKRAETRQTEAYKQRMKEFRASEAGKKSARISCWKQMGIVSDDYDALYNKWKETTHCEKCNVEMIEGNEGKHKKTLDHDHNTGQFRNILCHPCNVIRGNEDRGVIRQTNDEYNENRKWKRWIKTFQLRCAFRKLKIN